MATAVCVCEVDDRGGERGCGGGDLVNLLYVVHRSILYFFKIMPVLQSVLLQVFPLCQTEAEWCKEAQYYTECNVQHYMCTFSYMYMPSLSSMRSRVWELAHQHTIRPCYSQCCGYYSKWRFCIALRWASRWLALSSGSSSKYSIQSWLTFAWRMDGAWGWMSHYTDDYNLNYRHTKLPLLACSSKYSTQWHSTESTIYWSCSSTSWPL